MLVKQFVSDDKVNSKKVAAARTTQLTGSCCRRAVSLHAEKVVAGPQHMTCLSPPLL